MKRSFLFALILVLVGGAACGPRAPSSPPDATLELADHERTWVSRETVWGHGWVLPAGQHALELGPIPEDGFFRLSLLEDGDQPARIRGQMWAGDSMVSAFESAGPEQWAFGNADLSDYSGAECRVWLECSSPFVLGACELVRDVKTTPNVLIFLIDTLRQDHVSCYGYERDTTPNIDRFREDAILFTELMPPSSWTRPSVASLLTSTHPPTHGANDTLRMIRGNLPRLATKLQAQGYETHGLFTNLNCLPLWNFGTEFDTYTDVDSANWQQADDAQLVDRTLDMLPSLRGRPWFIYVHAMGPHAPYDPPGGYETKFQPETYEGTATEIARQKAIDLYDGEIAYTDAQFGRLVDELKRLDMYENTAIIVLSDHGEEFWEHGGTDHGKTLYEEQLRIPFLWKLPGEHLKGGHRDALVEMVDIAPTILELISAPPEPRFQGRSFWDYLNGGSIEPAIGYASLELNDANLRAAKTIEKKYLRDAETGESLWYDLTADPGEHDPLTEPPPWGSELAQLVDRMEQRGRSGLHILITREFGTEHELVFNIGTNRFGAYEMDFPHGRGGGLHGEKGVIFRVQLRDIEDPGIARMWRETRDHDNAHLFVEIPEDETFRLTIEKDGEVLGPDNVHVGHAMAPMTLDRVTLNPAAIAASWTDMEQVWHSQTFGVYVWYEATPGALRAEDLDPDVLEALRGHGYLAP